LYSRRATSRKELPLFGEVQEDVKTILHKIVRRLG